MRCTLRKLEHENADLKFLNNQYVAKIRCLEKDSRQKSDCILKLQEKNLHAVVQTPGKYSNLKSIDIDLENSLKMQIVFSSICRGSSG